MTTAFTVLVRGAWEGMLLAFAVVLLLRGWPRVGARSRYAALLLTFLCAALLPFLPVWPAVHALRGGDSVSVAEPLMRLPRMAVRGLLVLWLALSVYRSARLSLALAGLLGLRSRAVPADVPAAVRALLRGGPRAAELCTSDEVEVPCVLGFIRPRLLLPAGMLVQMTKADLRRVVLHEREHLRRYDDWWNALSKLALALLPLNPALWWLDRRLALERELASDAGAVADETPYAYASTLARLAEQRLGRRRGAGHVLLMAAWRRRTELALRVDALLSHQESGVGHGRWAFASAAALVVLLGGVAARVPQLVGVDTPSRVLSAGPDVRAMAVPAVVTNHTMPLRATDVVFRREVRHVPAKLRIPVRRGTPARAAVTRSVKFALPVQPSGARQVHAGPRAVLIDFPASYAAVPYGNGWLIFQL